MTNESEHTTEHERWLRVDALGDPGELPAGMRAQLAACPRCREERVALERFERDLAAVGDRSRADRESARALGDVPGLDRVERVLRAEIEASRAARPIVRRRSILPWVLAVAASLALVLGSWAWLGRDRAPSGREVEHTLGAGGFDSLTPAGAGASFAAFRWHHARADATRFDVHVYAPPPEPSGLPRRIADASVDAPTWIPSAAATQSWPDEIEWEVVAYDALDGRIGTSARMRASR